MTVGIPDRQLAVGHRDSKGASVTVRNSKQCLLEILEIVQRVTRNLEVPRNGFL
jgi:hypothetical protein